MARLSVLPSPLLGPPSYQPLAEALRRRGHEVSVAECPVPIRPQRLVEAWAEDASGADALVAHSNAGYLAGSVAAAGRTGPVLYVDAALPPRHGATRPAPADLLATLTGLADADGRLPPWTRWWPAPEIRELLPGVWFDRVDGSAPRVELAYFEAELVPPSGWSTRPAAYLAYGTTYEAELELARAAGWPVAQVPGHHLWHLARPDHVAAVLDELFTAASVR